MRNYASWPLILLALFCAGCGGGGGGGSSSTPPVSTLDLRVDAPSLNGKTGQDVTVPVAVTGTGTVRTASFDLHFNKDVFEPASGITVGGKSVAVAGLSKAVCRYKWIDSQTVRVKYASSDGAASGSTLVDIRLKVKSESASGLALQSVALN